MNHHGFLRIAAVSPIVHVGDPVANADGLLERLADHADADVVLFPELCLTGYTCEDLFHQQTLLRAAREQLQRIVEATAGRKQLVVVGLPLAVGNGLYNCAAAIADGELLGLVPKQFLPNYGEFYEARRFTPATGNELPFVELDAESAVPFGIDLLFFAVTKAGRRITVGIEICEDLWVPVPPSAWQALAGATVLLNPSASNEVIGKRAYRTNLVTSQSARCIAAYAYAGAGPTESTTDLVFGGHCLVAENGLLLAEADAVLLPKRGEGETGRRGEGEKPKAALWKTSAPPLPVSPSSPRGPAAAVADVDVEKLLHDRRTMVTFDDPARFLPRKYRWLEFGLRVKTPGRLKRAVSGTPFVPRDTVDLDERCREIFSIQCCGLAKRLDRLSKESPLQIGVSGGLDSTLALLVAVKTCDLVGSPRSRIHGLTMPGFGTTSRTRQNAIALMEHLGVTAETIDVRPLCLESFRELKHRPFGIDPTELEVDAFQEALHAVPIDQQHDLVFENVQARLRTFLLMSRGFVIGTGDLSEAALGWSTYNGDHMSMYNPNCSIPKTLVQFLVRYVAQHEFDGPARKTLLDVAATTISPELLPVGRNGEIVQATEDTLGRYELHDFFLFNVVRNGFGPAKLLYLASQADFREEHSPEAVETALRTFYTRFFANQFKRSCVPDGPKVGTVSLSPRGDWRMPSDAEVTAWLAEIEGEKTSRKDAKARRKKKGERQA
ncbi:MAG: NAD(+) synthase [Planctomycetaceae bacterium]